MRPIQARPRGPAAFALLGLLALPLLALAEGAPEMMIYLHLEIHGQNAEAIAAPERIAALPRCGRRRR
jgi:hypothetical protein